MSFKSWQLKGKYSSHHRVLTQRGISEFRNLEIIFFLFYTSMIVHEVSKFGILAPISIIRTGMERKANLYRHTYAMSEEWYFMEDTILKILKLFSAVYSRNSGQCAKRVSKNGQNQLWGAKEERRHRGPRGVEGAPSARAPVPGPVPLHGKEEEAIAKRLDNRRHGSRNLGRSAIGFPDIRSLGTRGFEGFQAWECQDKVGIDLKFRTVLSPWQEWRVHVCQSKH